LETPLNDSAIHGLSSISETGRVALTQRYLLREGLGEVPIDPKNHTEPHYCLRNQNKDMRKISPARLAC